MIRTLAATLLIATALPAHAFDTQASAAYVYDMTTGTVLLNKDADVPLPPASMSKLMTLYMAFEALERGQISMTDTLPVSSHAASFSGSTLFLQAGERVTVEDLVRGVIVLSGNDATVAIGEALSPDGTEGGFARLMTRRAQEMGMTNSTFANASGWPNPSHRMSMRDLGLLSTRLIEDFPEYYPMFAETEFLFDEKESANRYNRNPLLGLGIGADGLKTGHTQAAGYGLAGSAKQGDRRIVFVVSGLDTAAARAQEAEAIVNWSFRQFSRSTIAREGARIATAPIWEGAEPEVGLVPASDISVLLPILTGDTIDAEVVYTGPVQAPVAAGTPLAKLVIRPDGLPEQSFDLVAEADVAHGGFLARVATAAKVLLTRVAGEDGA
ncbi:MAG: D-alanyl-D-alanine carboxypeptidase family protein [Pseudomonadota bacterium]